MCCPSCCFPLASLDVGGAVICGAVQIISGVFSIVFYSAAIGYHDNHYPGGTFLYSGTGIEAGFFVILAGVLLLVAGMKRSFCCIIAVLVITIINIPLTMCHFWLTFVILFVDDAHENWHCVDSLPPDPLQTPCDDTAYSVMLFLVSASVACAFVFLFTVFWTIVIASKALWKRRDTPPPPPHAQRDSSHNHHQSTINQESSTLSKERHRNGHARSRFLLFNWLVQGICSSTSSFSGFLILLIVAYGVKSGDWDKRVLYLQCLGTSLWCMPVYVLNCFLGFRAWRFGENTSLITFLVLNLLQLFLVPWEMAMSANAIVDGKSRSSMLVMNYVQVETWKWEWQVPNDGARFKGPLIGLHSLIIVAATTHLIATIWAIVTASYAVHSDGACNNGARCCCCCCCGEGNGGCCGCKQMEEDTIPCIVTNEHDLTPISVAS